MSLPSTIDFYIAKRKDDDNHYSVVNTHYEVVEHKDAVLTRAYAAMIVMQKEYNKMLADIEAEKQAKAARAKVKGVKS